MKPRALALVFVLLLGAAASRPAAQGSGLVKITPLGSHAGELCRNDRAMRVEDPTGVRIAVVQAVHSNGINAQFIETPGVAGALSGYGGSEGGFVLTFTNGLVAYLTGDTGMFGDMNTIVAQYYKPTLIVLNMSDTATLGPEEAAFVIKTLVRPR